MMNTAVWANAFGVLGIVTTAVIYQQKENRKMLIWKLISDALWIVHYLFLGAYSVAVVTVVALVRSGVLLCQNHAWARHKAWLWIFLGSSLGLSLMAWKDWTSSLVAIGSLACIIVFWMGIPRITRLVSIPVSVMFLMNVALNGSVWGTLNESFLLLSAVVGMIRLDRRTESSGEKTFAEKRSESA